jgi:hypothetical protein
LRAIIRRVLCLPLCRALLRLLNSSAVSQQDCQNKR